MKHVLRILSQRSPLRLAIAGALLSAVALASDTIDHLRPFDAFQPKIVNGLTTVGFPSVALLGVRNADGIGLCTATLIGCRTLLTAAHCFCSETPGFLCEPNTGTVSAVFFQHAAARRITQVFVHPDWSPSERNRHDLAILHLERSVSGITASRLNTVSRVRNGTQGVTVGYGTTLGGGSDFGLKRFGAVTTAPCINGDPSTQLCWNFAFPLGPPGQDSNTCQGDSGGPAFFSSQTGDSVLAGVTSFGNASCLPEDNAKDADIFVDREWIQRTAGVDLGTTICGPLPQAGSARAPISFAEGLLDQANDAETWIFQVEQGTDILRIALNAEQPLGVDFGGNDFDLLVKRGAPPTNVDMSDCVSISEYATEFCEIESPEPGSWYAKVQNFGGAGRYQLTATQFLSAEAPPRCSGRAESLLLHNRFRISGNAFLRGDPAPFLLQNLCGPEGVSPTALAFYFNANRPARQEGFISITNNCDRAAQTFKVEVASASTRKFTIEVVDTLTGLSASYSNPNPGRSAFFPVDRTSFAESCQVSSP